MKLETSYNSAFAPLGIQLKWLFKILLVIGVLMTVTGCKKFVTADPPGNSLTSDNVYKDDATAASVLTNVYTIILRGTPIRGQSMHSIPLVTALSSDELGLFAGTANGNTQLKNYYFYTLTAGSGSSPEPTIWTNIYSQIYVVNLALERLTASTGLTPGVRSQLMGEAKFLRAFFYFYLVNLYGDVPLALTSDYRTNAVLSRTPKADVYQQIINDLKDAQNLLGDNYVDADAKTISIDRVRPNKWAATALLARAYLYNGNWAEAETQATAVINNSAKFGLTPLNSAFLKNTNEAIWQLQPIQQGWNTEYAKLFILPSGGPNTSGADDGHPVFISNYLLNAFEPNDGRKTTWLGSVTVGSGAATATYYFPYKYKSATQNASVTEYLTVLRLGEQYLIRAEARAKQNKITEAKADLNAVRTRAGLPNTTAVDQPSLLTAILHERQVELFTEWGHRWMDLKRTNNVDAVMNGVAVMRGVTWSSNWKLYPIPAYDITQDPNLTQNPGY